MAQADASIPDPVSPTSSQGQMQQSLWRRFFGRDKENGNNGTPGSADTSSRGQGSEQQDEKAGIIRRVSRKVVPGLPRAQTFKRQQSELRDKLEPVKQTPAERRAVSVDRRVQASSIGFSQSNPRTSAPDFHSRSFSVTASIPSLPTSPARDAMLDSIGELNGLGAHEDVADDLSYMPDAISNIDAQSMTTSQYDHMIHDELERSWILNLSMHFRDKSKREKFFVTYRENNILWRRVTISLDYRNAPENSLELDLVHTKFQRDKSAKIYEAIRESLGDIQFYDTVTNLKLQTTEGRLHVHVVEDVNEIISYPTVRMIQHMRCRRVKESELEFDSHLSGFVYKVRVNGQVLIKKEIPGPDTVDEFLYEINALNRLRSAENVIQFYGVVVDDKEEIIKGLLISYAEQGALIDIIYDHNHSLPWATRERWARQIVNGLAEIHEAGFVQGDFTLSNIVINDEGDAKIIDINRRGCPVGWEPPEATPLIESNQRISMYIGVKSDLFQLGMVLWALATQEDEPEAHGRPLRIGADVHVPSWFGQIVATCLSEDPRRRLQALQLASMFPEPREDSHHGVPNGSALSADDRYSHQEFGADRSRLTSRDRVNDWSYVGWASPPNQTTDDLHYFPTRGRSPPSPMPSNHDDAMRYDSHLRPWTDKRAMNAPSFSDFSRSEIQAQSDVDRRAAVDSSAANQAAQKQPEEVGSISLPANRDESISPKTTGAMPPLNFDDNKKALPRSLADSGKDLSESTATPAASSAAGSDEPVTGTMLKSGETETHQEPQTRAPLLAETARSASREDGILDANSDMRGTSLFTSTSFSSSRATSTSTPVREVPDDLKGIGSAYDLTLDRRQDAMILDDDFGVELGSIPEDSLALRQPSPKPQFQYTMTAAPRPATTTTTTNESAEISATIT